MEIVRLKYTLSWLAMVTTGMLFIWLSTVSETNPQLRLNLFIQAIGVAFLISGAWTAVQEYLVRKDVEKQNQTLVERVEQLYDRGTELERIGLVWVLDKSTSFNYSELIETSEEFTFVLNDGLTWIGHYMDSIKRRLDKRHTSTRFIVVHPDSDYVADLANRTGIDQVYQREKILEACNKLIREYEYSSEGSRGTLEIYGHQLPNVLATYMTNKLLLIEPYFYSVGRNTPPLFAIEPRTGDSYFARAKRDLDSLIEPPSILLYRSGQRFETLSGIS